MTNVCTKYYHDISQFSLCLGILKIILGHRGTANEYVYRREPRLENFVYLWLIQLLEFF